MTAPNGRVGLAFIHGATLNRRMWDPIVERFQPRYPVVVPDLPGHGTLANEPFTMKGAVAVVKAAVAGLDASKVVLVGDSLGSYVSIASASALGDQFAGAVLGGGTARFHGATPVAHLIQGAMMKVLGSRILRPWLEHKVASDFQAGPAAVAAGIRTGAFREAVEELRGVNMTKLLQDIRAPLLFVNGVTDRPHRAGEARSLAAAPAARLVVMAGVGHGVTLRKPAEFSALLVEFLSANGLAAT